MIEAHDITYLLLVEEGYSTKYSRIQKEWFDPTFKQWQDWEITTADKNQDGITIIMKKELSVVVLPLQTM